MFGRFGWAEILVVVVLVLILFGHNKIPGMMKNLADGINVFKKELKTKEDSKSVTEKKDDNKKSVSTSKKSTAKKTVKKKTKVSVVKQK